MSRHRNIRQLVQEEDYYDDYDDEYDDGYDDYDEPGYAKPAAPKKPTTTTKTTKTQQTTPTKKQQQPSTQKNPIKNAAATIAPKTAKVGGGGGQGITVLPPPTKPKVSTGGTITAGNQNSNVMKKPQSQHATAAGNLPPLLSAAKSGIQPPPPGFSASPPSVVAATAAATSRTKSPQRVGVVTPPPGFSTAPPPPTAPSIDDPNNTKNDKNPTTTSTLNQNKNNNDNKQPQQQHQSNGSKPPTTIPLPESLLQQLEPSNDHNNNNNNKPTVTCVILGHVDAGKSTLTGHLLWEAATSSSPPPPTMTSSSKNTKNQNNTKTKNDPTTAPTVKQPIRQQPANFAWLLDEDETERQHGITMDVATKTLVGRDYQWVVHDAPGHADYVPNMMVGTALADVAIVVVDVTDNYTATKNTTTSTDNNNTVAPQLREHLFLAKGLGVSQILIALNKMDLVNWDSQVYQRQVQTITQFVVYTVKFAKTKIQFLPISGLQGINIYHPPSSIISSSTCPALTQWYGNGPSLWQALEQLDLFPNQNKNNSNKNTQQNNNNKPRQQRVPRIKLLEKPLRILITDILQETRSGGVAVRAKVIAGWFHPPPSATTDTSSSSTVSTVPVDGRLLVVPVGEAVRITSWVPVHEEAVSVSNKNNNNNNNNTSKNVAAKRNQAPRFVVAGDWIDFVLTGLDLTRWSVGCVLTRTNDLSLQTRMHPTTTADPDASATDMATMTAQKCICRIYVLDTVTVPIIRGTSALFHIHTITGIPCHLSQLLSSAKMMTTTTTATQPPTDNNTNGDGLFWKDRPRALTKQSQAVVEITIPKPPQALSVVLEPFAENRALGRFVLRRNGESIAVGRIEQILTS